jgi:hypothetical protein
MNLLPLNKYFVEQQIKQQLEAILIDVPKHKCMVGIPGGQKNEKSVKKYSKFDRETYKEIDYQVWKHWRYRKFSPGTKVAITKELVRRQDQEQVDIAYYAAKNEFGSMSDKVPARPFLRTTFQGERLEKIQKKAQAILSDCAMQNRNAEDFLNQIGLYAASEVQRNITDGSFQPNPPNAPLTIAIKGSSHTLIDTGTMRRAITAWVTKK